MLENIVKELKTRPFTMILMLSLWVAVGVLWTNRSTEASAADLNSVRAEVATVRGEVADVKYSVQRSSLESHLREIQTELFQLQRTVEELVAAHRKPDNIYYTRMSELQNDRDQVQRQLAALSNRSQ